MKPNNLKLKQMKKILTILCAVILTFNAYAQPSKGSLLLEGSLTGAWTGIAIDNANVFGVYFSDKFALVGGTKGGLINDETLMTVLGARVHFSESTLLFTNIVYNDVPETLGIALGVGNRFYANDWLAFEPRAGIAYDIENEVMTFQTTISVCVFFEQP